MIELKRSSLTPDQQRKRDGRCRQLSDDIVDIKKSIRRLSARRAQKLREAQRLRFQAKELADRKFKNDIINALFNAVGTAISRGKVKNVGSAVGNVMGTIGSIFGLTSIGQQIGRILRRIEGLMLEFKDLGGQMDHLTNGMARMARERQRLDC